MQRQGGDIAVGFEQTVDTLVETISRLAISGDFRKAEQMREHLLESHPMALSAIISTAETIEAQKTLRIDQNHLAVWETLYRGLSREERNCLFYSTQVGVIPAGKLLLRQGKPTSSLLFVESGQITLFHTRGTARILLGQMSRGDVLGEETFFACSTPTFSAGCRTQARLRYLDKSATANWEERHPGLYQKLAEYCRQNCRAERLLKGNKIEKRIHPRAKAEGKVRAYILGSDGGRTGEYICGSMIDLSRGGISFDIYCSKAENAKVLLSRVLDLEVEYAAIGKATPVKLSGTIVKVGHLLHNDYSVHVQLQSVLSQEEFLRYAGRNRGLR